MRIAPHDFNKESIHAIEDSINTKYANRLIKNIGLCISVRDILSASEGLIGNLDGYVYVQGKGCVFELEMELFKANGITPQSSST